MSIAIRFLRRRNIGNYEHTELEITDSVEKKSDLNSDVNEVMNTVKDALYSTGAFAPGSVFANLGSEEVKTPAAPAATTTVAKKTTTTTTVAKTEVVKKDEPAKIENQNAADAPATDTKPQETAAKVETPAATTPAPAEKKEAVKKAETTRVVKKSAATAYNREDNTHKNILGVFLDQKYPTWRKPENLKKAGAASRELQGKEFLDAEGNIIEPFKEAFCKHMVDLV